MAVVGILFEYRDSYAMNQTRTYVYTILVNKSSNIILGNNVIRVSN